MEESELNDVAFARGRKDAMKDIEAGSPRLYWGTRGFWKDYFEKLFRSRFGVEVESTSCFVWTELTAYRNGYNETIKAHIERIHGPDAFDKACDEVKKYRLECYRKYEEQSRKQFP